MDSARESEVTLLVLGRRTGAVLNTDIGWGNKEEKMWKLE
jgi:hypothetical protein